MRIGTFIQSSLSVAALALGMALTASSVQAQNVLTNPGFEADNTAGGDVAPSSWSTFNAASSSASVTPHAGTNTLKLFGPFFNGGGAGATQKVAAAPGDIWTTSVFARNDSSDAMGVNNFFVLQAQYLDAGNTVIGQADSAHFEATAPQNVWTPLTATLGVAPAATTQVQIVLVHVQLDPVDGGSVWLDDASLSKVVPEPASIAALGLAGLGLISRRRRTA